MTQQHPPTGGHHYDQELILLFQIISTTTRQQCSSKGGRTFRFTYEQWPREEGRCGSSPTRNCVINRSAPNLKPSLPLISRKKVSVLYSPRAGEHVRLRADDNTTCEVQVLPIPPLPITNR
eukprot:TRINITY_DN4061_c4_g1_i1.p3 TRINITY_DN4061_c4_g1~~TRINITY_DN4061_c4_g1_i1.p3  ORF type:complete len:121 (+),score=12.98 TRINITY_DN4061_c4_g1_i1:279-641(+)